MLLQHPTPSPRPSHLPTRRLGERRWQEAASDVFTTVAGAKHDTKVPTILWKRNATVNTTTRGAMNVNEMRVEQWEVILSAAPPSSINYNRGISNFHLGINCDLISASLCHYRPTSARLLGCSVCWKLWSRWWGSWSWYHTPTSALITTSDGGRICLGSQDHGSQVRGKVLSNKWKRKFAKLVQTLLGPSPCWK